jgi:hypothetical protein
MAEFSPPGPPSEPGIITHYLPQFVLKHFRDTALYELDKSTSQITVRNVRKSGQEIDLYPPALENGLFREMDNAAARIFREKLYGKERRHIAISDREKRVLSEWLLLFAVRIPLNLEICEAQAREWNNSPAHSIEVLKEEFDDLIIGIKRDAPDRYREITARMGEDNFKLAFYEILRQRIIRGEARRPASGRPIFERMHQSGRHKEYARFVYNLHWTWLRTNGSFVIGDNPLCRWHTKLHASGHGLARHHLEITIPLTRHMTLWMHRNYNHAELTVCNGKRTRELNRRQIVSAARWVYGPSIAALTNHRLHH